MNDLERKIHDHEGFSSVAYPDHLGNITIGFGRNIDSKTGRGITKDEALYLMRNDIKICRKSLVNFTWFRHLDIVRQDVLVELMYNIGYHRFMTFKKMIAALEINDFNKASVELLDSKWRTDVGKNRSSDMAFRLKYGAYKGEALT